MPAHANDHGDLALNGIASYWILNNELYVGSLYLEQKQNTAESIVNAGGRKRMEFRITTDKWRERNFNKTWSRAISINNNEDVIQGLSAEIIAFSNMLQGPLLYGDKVTIDYTPAKSTRVSINGTELYATKNTNFFNALVKAWVGPRPPSTDFKNGILSIDPQDFDTQDLLGRYDYIRPDLENQRNNEIANWAKAQKKTKKPVSPRPAAKATNKQISKTEPAAATKIAAAPIKTEPVTIAATSPATPAQKASDATVAVSLPELETPNNTPTAAVIAKPATSQAATPDAVAPITTAPSNNSTEVVSVATQEQEQEQEIKTQPLLTALPGHDASSSLEESDIAPSTANKHSNNIETVADDQPGNDAIDNTITQETNETADATPIKAAKTSATENSFESLLSELENKTLAD